MYTVLYIARFIESVGVQAMKRTEIKRRPLSDTVLANLEPEAKEYRELDGEGLYFRVKPDGKKAWLFRYKKADGKWSWLGIGTYPELSGAGARKKAREIIKDISQGDNPIITKQERKRQELEQNNATFEVLAREWLDTKANTWVKDTMTRNKGALEKHIFPIFGKRLYTTIKPIEWMNHLKGIQQKQGIYEQVNRVRAMCEYVGDYQTKEYILHVKAFFEANESSRFEAITPDPDHIEKIINRVGYWKIENGEKLFLVLPEQFKNEVCKGHDNRKVAKALLIEKLLEHDTGKTTKTVRLPSRTKAIRVYAIKDAIFSWE